MAQDYNIAPIFRGASGGFSDDLYTGIQDSFYSGKNCEIRENAKAISISKALLKDTGSIVTEQINVIVKTGSAQWVAFGNSGGIYVKNAGTWTKVTTSTAVQPITGASVFGIYLYWATTTSLNRILLTNIATRASEVIGWETLLSTNYHPMKSTAIELVIGDGYQVDTIDTADYFSVKVTLDKNIGVTIINEIGGTVILYCSNIQNDGSYLYLWDGIKTVPDQAIPFDGFKIYQAIIFNGLNYVVTNKGIGYIDGYNWIPIKKAEVFTNARNAICVHNEKIYVGGNGGVYVFGKKNKNYPEVLNFEHMTSLDSDLSLTGAMTSDGTNLLVSWSRSGASLWGIDLLSTTTYNLYAQHISRAFFGNSLAEIKGGMYIRAGFKPLITGQSITYSYSLNGGAYVDLASITPTSDKKTSFSTSQKLNGQFQYILFKTTLVGPGTSTPEHYTLDFYYDTMLD